MGSSLLALFVSPGLPRQLGFWTIFIAHVMFCLSFVVVTVKARLMGLDPRLEQAAMDLYANEWQTFWRVTFPLVLPGIVGGGAARFSLSFDDFIITNFTSGQTVDVPDVRLRRQPAGFPLQINVVGTIDVLRVVPVRRRRRAVAPPPPHPLTSRPVTGRAAPGDRSSRPSWSSGATCSPVTPTDRSATG